MAVQCKNCNFTITDIEFFIGFYQRSLIFTKLTSISYLDPSLDSSYTLKSCIVCPSCKYTLGHFYQACPPSLSSLAGLYELHPSSIISPICYSSLSSLYSQLLSLRQEVLSLEQAMRSYEYIS
jgi:hypothetical protein